MSSKEASNAALRTSVTNRRSSARIANAQQKADTRVIPSTSPPRAREKDSITNNVVDTTDGALSAPTFNFSTKNISSAPSFTSLGDSIEDSNDEDIEFVSADESVIDQDKQTTKTPSTSNVNIATTSRKRKLKSESDFDFDFDPSKLDVWSTQKKHRNTGEAAARSPINEKGNKGKLKSVSKVGSFPRKMENAIQESKITSSPSTSNNTMSSTFTFRPRRGNASTSALNTPTTTVSADVFDHHSVDPDSSFSEFEDLEEIEDSDSDFINEPASTNDHQSRPLSAGRSTEVQQTPVSQRGSDAEDEPVPQPVRRRGRRRGQPRLTWEEKNELALFTHHPELVDVWKDMENMEKIKPTQAPQPTNLKLQLLPFQLEGLHWMLEQEKKEEFRGGILADEMGMGKTIQCVSLLVSEPRRKPNIVVAPAVAIIQWKNEIEKYCGDHVSVLIFHGPNRSKDINELKKYDIVLTTYSVLQSHWTRQTRGVWTKKDTANISTGSKSRKAARKTYNVRKEKSILHEIEWHRVVLDEAHNIKDRTTGTAKAAFSLNGKYRWSLTGTPLQNRVGELYSLLRFLSADPYSHYFCKKCDCKSLTWSFKKNYCCDICGHKPMDHVCWWNNEILKPIQKYGTNGFGKVAFKKLRLLLSRIMLRRTRDERNAELGLPPRIVEMRRDYFNEEEEDLYMSLYQTVSRKFATYVDQRVVLNNYANIFTLLTNMRQMADHPDLVLRRQSEKTESTVCRICQEEAEDPIMSKCRHIFCRTCAEQYLETAIDETPRCQACQSLLTIDLEGPTYEPVEVDEKAMARLSIVDRLDMSRWRSSTKIEGLIEELDIARASGEKSLVFSQFVNFLDMIEWRLKRAGYNCVKLDGKMTPEARNAAIQYFSNNPTCTVFLISLKAGGVALNLTEASRVFIMDPWWNPAVQTQAADRVSRLGQKRPIRITLMIIENSIEQRILQLQEKKQQMAESALSHDDNALGRLTEEDLRFLFVL